MSSKDWSNDEPMSPPIELHEHSIELQPAVTQQPTLSGGIPSPSIAIMNNSSSSNINNSNSSINTTKKPNKLGYLPALSISKPSPPHEQEELML